MPSMGSRLAELIASFTIAGPAASRKTVPGGETIRRVCDGRSRLTVFCREVLARELASFFKLSDALGPEADAELIHDLRVQTRRLAEGVEILAPIAPEPLVLGSRAFLQTLIRLLSPIRNSDVTRALLCEILKRNIPVLEKEAVLDLERRLRKRRGRKLDEALRFWRRRETAERIAELALMRRVFSGAGLGAKDRFLDVLKAHLATRRREAQRCLGPAVSSVLETPGSQGLPSGGTQTSERLVRKMGRWGRKDTHSGLSSSLDRELHELRRALRLLRYSGEAARPATRCPRMDALHRIRRFQQVLGEHHDLAVLLRRIGRMKEELREGKNDGGRLSRGLDRLSIRSQRLQRGKARVFRRLVS